MATAHSQGWVFQSLQRKEWAGPIIDLGAGGNAAWYRGLFKNEIYKTLDIVQNKDNSIDYIADIHNLEKLAPNSFGVVLLLDTLEHLAFPHLAFKESSRILKIGGMFICTTVAAWEQHNHPVDYWRFLPDGLVFLSVSVGLKPFCVGCEKIGEEGRITCCVSAIKIK